MSETIKTGYTKTGQNIELKSEPTWAKGSFQIVYLYPNGSTHHTEYHDTWFQANTKWEEVTRVK